MNLPISAILGIIAPALVSFLKNVAWPVWARVLVTFTVCAVLGAISVFASSSVTVDDYAASVGTIFTVATVFYQTYFENTGINTTLEQQLYKKTSASVKAQVETPAEDAVDKSA